MKVWIRPMINQRTHPSFPCGYKITKQPSVKWLKQEQQQLCLHTATVVPLWNYNLFFFNNYERLLHFFCLYIQFGSDKHASYLQLNENRLDHQWSVKEIRCKHHKYMEYISSCFSFTCSLMLLMNRCVALPKLLTLQNRNIRLVKAPMEWDHGNYRL